MPDVNCSHHIWHGGNGNGNGRRFNFQPYPQSWRDQLVKYWRFISFRMDLDNEAYSVFTALDNINTTSSIVFIAHKNYTKRVCRLALFLSMDINLLRNRKWIERFWLRYMPFINQTLPIVETSISLSSLTPSQSQTPNGYIFELTWTANRSDDSQGSLYKHGENPASLVVKGEFYPIGLHPPRGSST